MKYYLICNGFFLCLAAALTIPFATIYYLPQLVNYSSVNINNNPVMPTLTKSLPVTSPAFSSNGNIPIKYTCEGQNINPPLTVGNLPQGTKSLALIMDDPDAPKGTFVHWVAYNIAPDEKIIENKEPGTSGRNGAGKEGYTGPCPPSGTHHYHFKIYALDAKVDLQKGADKNTVEEAIKLHIIASGELIGLYKKVKQ